MTEQLQRGPVSWETWHFMRQEIERLQAENERLTREAAYWEQQTNHWYLKANYSPAQLDGFRRRRAAGPPWSTNNTRTSNP